MISKGFDFKNSGLEEWPCAEISDPTNSLISGGRDKKGA